MLIFAVSILIVAMILAARAQKIGCAMACLGGILFLLDIYLTPYVTGRSWFLDLAYDGRLGTVNRTNSGPAGFLGIWIGSLGLLFGSMELLGWIEPIKANEPKQSSEL